MRLAVITPLHEIGNRFIGETYASLVKQTFADWHWYILENKGGFVPDEIRADQRVVVLSTDDESAGVGALKAQLCAAVEEEAIVELDCDDELSKDALVNIERVFRLLDADFVYSNFAEWKDEDGTVVPTWTGYPYGSAYGWSHYAVKHRGVELRAMNAPRVTPQNLRSVLWSPNHVRAWRKDSYERAGGHDSTIAVGDDHDLIVRMYLSGAKFTHISRCLYFYRVHAENTVKTKNAEIQVATRSVYNKQLYPLAEKFAKDNGLLCVDLCGAVAKPNGYVSIDKQATSDPKDIVCDLEGPWLLEDNSVGVLRASDAIEHLCNPIHTMNEAYRVLAPGGFFMIDVPSTDGRGAFQDPTHVSYWNENSFGYYTDKNFAKYIPEFKGRFQLIKNMTWFPSKWHEERKISYCQTHMIALKEGYKPYGEVNW